MAAVAARVRLEEEMAALALRMEEATAVAAADALRLQQVQAELGCSVVPPAEPTPAPQSAADTDETLCVLCMDAPKDHIIIPCGHQCVCEACAEKLKKARKALCPFCRVPINATFKVFVV